MQTELIDIKKLIEPISPEKPAGDYLRYEKVYDEITNAMKGEDPNLSQGVWIRPVKKYDWVKAKELCVDALKDKTKDVQIVCWLTESLMYIHGFNGLAQGLELLLAVSKKHWDNLHPLPEADDIELRLAPYEWLSEKFYIQLTLVPIVKAESISEGYSFYSWEKKIKTAHENHEDESLALEEYSTAVSLSSEEFHTDMDDSVERSLRSIKELKEFLSSKVSGSVPSFTRLVQTLEKIKDLNKTAVIFFLKKKEAREKRIEHAESDGGAPGGEEKIFEFAQPEINNIDNAYESLEQISNFLMENEPEYATGLMIKQAISYKKMDVKEFLSRRVSNKKNLTKVFEILNLS